MTARDRLIPWLFVGGFAIVIAANVVLVVLATWTFAGLETLWAYDRGLAYNATLEAAEHQRARGWSVAVEAVARENRVMDVIARFVGPDGKPLVDLDVEAVLTRPVRAGFDRTVTLAPRSDGIYRTTVELPLSGQWDLRVIARRGSDDWQDRKRIRVP